MTPPAADDHGPRPGMAPGVTTGTTLDRFLGSDPGLNRLRTALMTVLTIGLILQAEWLLVHFTDALQIQTAPGVTLPAAQAAQVAVANHDYLVIMMLLGAIVGMISGFGVMEPDAKGQLITVLFLPFPMLAALALGIAVGGHRILSLVLLAVILAAGTYLRRFGPRGDGVGDVALHGLLLRLLPARRRSRSATSAGSWPPSASATPWPSSSASASSIPARPTGAATDAALLRRPGRARWPRWPSSCSRTLRTASATSRRLQRHLVRLNEAALMIDAQLGDPAAVGRRLLRAAAPSAPLRHRAGPHQHRPLRRGHGTSRPAGWTSAPRCGWRCADIASSDLAGAGPTRPDAARASPRRRLPRAARVGR